MSLSDEFYEALHELEGEYERWQDLPDDHPKIKRIKKLARVNEGLRGKNTWYPEEITFIQNNINDLTYNEMAIELERGYHELKNKIGNLRKKGLLPDRTNSKAVIVTGASKHRFESMKDCAEYFSISEFLVKKMCDGERKGLYGLDFQYVKGSAALCGTTAQGSN